MVVVLLVVVVVLLVVVAVQVVVVVMEVMAAAVVAHLEAVQMVVADHRMPRRLELTLHRHIRHLPVCTQTETIQTQLRPSQRATSCPARRFGSKVHLYSSTQLAPTSRW